jgi:excisionase family DNA binding protein
MPEPEELLTVAQAADFLQIHEKTLYGWVQSHRVPHLRLGTRAIRFRKSDLLSFLERFAVPSR